MSAQPVEGGPIVLDMVEDCGTWWMVTERDEQGFPTAMHLMRDVAVVRDASGEVLGYSVGVHPSRGLLHPTDVIYRPHAPAASPRSRGHVCAALAGLDCYAADGDATAARLARFHEDHPNGPQTAEDYAEEQAIRAGFTKRSRGVDG